MRFAKFIDNQIEYVEGNTINLNGVLVICPSLAQRAKVGIYPVEDIAADGTDELINGVIKHYTGGRHLSDAKKEMIAKIDAYDTSDNVNAFVYNGVTMWLDKSTRVGVVNAINGALRLGKTEITIGLGSYSVTMKSTEEMNTMLGMFDQLEMYALDCYNVTLAHKNEVNALETIEEVDNYDYTTGYPDKLEFNF